ncbi:AraC family transcriptional regulator [Acinetobacter baumannii]|uniref:AraC family transcriptional regulator n=3 Tax=Acinetobacter calcoaceticus/baumannii complex TaxID=909768 RepID=UPI0009929510|nr:AraC family transcriptional regulator [Acinetobacter baumannii]MDC5346288.1 AraC family transcriptional regulator [Acinetobacter baumannii]MDO7478623.1 AraC family transcriptional regulator [Acinetobacter baumannii]OOU93591.1 AraC family transcriptional regulator [Acinetobacter baumannii]OTR92262.1 AraC family transcriptional regulator [Acinetobacter baumannii]HAV4441183.1 helix-turn-helix domain-containing protein [Acinetobacter baumannii]
MVVQSSLSKGTISIALVHEALSAAYAKGLNTQIILNKAGIPTELLMTSKARVPVATYAQLWIELANAMNDEFFGMDSHPMRRGSYKLLTKLVSTAETLEKALYDILNFFNFVLDDIRGELIREQEKAYLVIRDREQPKRMFTYATFLMLVHGLMCWLVDQRIGLNRITVRCPKPNDIQDYLVRFCEDIQFNAETNQIEFDAHYLDIKIKKDKKALYDFLEQTPQNLLVRFKNENALSVLIRRHLLKLHPAQWPELKDVAQQLNISEATVQRRLKHEGVSYQQIKNEIRCDIAIERLSKSNDSIQDISEDLNFHDPSAFHRAFKKWTGVSPGAYREATLNSTA